MSAFDFTFAFVRVVSSYLSKDDATTVPLYNVTTDPNDALAAAETAEAAAAALEEVDADAETSIGEEGYGPPGMVFRPLAPDADGCPEGFLEAISARVGDGLVPIAWRDLRMLRRSPNPKAGEWRQAGYFGGFLAIAPTSTDSGSHRADTITLYAPYEFDGNGVPQKAHLIAIDTEPGNESLSIVHGEGQMLLMNDEGQLTMASADGDYIQLEPGKITLQAAQIVLNGGALVVGNPLGALSPLLPGVASPPCPRLLLNPAA